MAHWIFKCNPDLYRLEERLADPNPTLTWSIKKYYDQIHAGDTVYLWATGSKRGIRAVLRVEQPPKQMSELDSEQNYWATRDTKVVSRVICSLVRRDINLPSAKLKREDGLAGLSVFTGYKQGTNYSVTLEQGVILSRLIDDMPAILP